MKVLWAYAAGHVDGGEDDGYPDGWLRLVMPSDEDMTRSRWPLLLRQSRSYTNPHSKGLH